MKSKFSLILVLFQLVSFTGQAQETQKLTLKQTVEMATTQSKQAVLAEAKVTTSDYEVKKAKNNRYPSATLSGQYFRLTEPNISSPLFGDSSSGSSAGSTGKINQLLLGMANVSIPVFNGFKISQNIKASENLHESESLEAEYTKEQVALYATNLYLAIYKTQQMLDLLQDNLKSAHQRVVDFQAMEDNGLLAHNDMLKAQLQESNVQLMIDQNQKNLDVLNFKLKNLLGIAENSTIEIDPNGIDSFQAIAAGDAQRSDLQAAEYKQKAAENGIKIAQGNYYPSINLVGGYVAVDIKNAFTMTNAINFGVGVSYDLSSIFKNNAEVKVAKSKSEEAKQSVALLTDQIKEEVHEAQENYTLAQKQYNVYNLAAEQATENYRIVKDKYDNGLSNTNDLLEADVEQLQANINKAVSKADILQKYYELAFAKGNLTQSVQQ
ncbi:TolC family protein [Flavobacterium sp. NRK F10]|uniref:TolC family protein n=1 Tax=Flavobacterium sp. NRK F10 TaxID=2954931 RepID=UPI002090A8BD|nr:TolC family protein [Flavobacterium sp. NRK F10]MCO6176063.1 TolC family protein [Flavobacterium sp. NRK F10]